MKVRHGVGGNGEERGGRRRVEKERVVEGNDVNG